MILTRLTSPGNRYLIALAVVAIVAVVVAVVVAVAQWWQG